MSPDVLRRLIRTTLEEHAARGLDNEADRAAVEAALVRALSPPTGTSDIAATYSASSTLQPGECERCKFDSLAGFHSNVERMISLSLRKVYSLTELLDFPHRCGKVCGLRLPRDGGTTCVLPPDHLVSECCDGHTWASPHVGLTPEARERFRPGADRVAEWRKAKPERRKELERAYAALPRKPGKAISPERAYLLFLRAVNAFDGGRHRRR